MKKFVSNGTEFSYDYNGKMITIYDGESTVEIPFKCVGAFVSDFSKFHKVCKNCSEVKTNSEFNRDAGRVCRDCCKYRGHKYNLRYWKTKMEDPERAQREKERKGIAIE